VKKKGLAKSVYTKGAQEVFPQVYEEFEEEVREVSIRAKNPKTTMNEDEGDLPMIARLITWACIWRF